MARCGPERSVAKTKEFEISRGTLCRRNWSSSSGLLYERHPLSQPCRVGPLARQIWRAGLAENARASGPSRQGPPSKTRLHCLDNDSDKAVFFSKSTHRRWHDPSWAYYRLDFPVVNRGYVSKAHVLKSFRFSCCACAVLYLSQADFTIYKAITAIRPHNLFATVLKPSYSPLNSHISRQQCSS